VGSARAIRLGHERSAFCEAEAEANRIFSISRDTATQTWKMTRNRLNSAPGNSAS
jgi:hypothetical protein